jgi:hypothetical protein
MVSGELKNDERAGSHKRSQRDGVISRMETRKQAIVEVTTMRTDAAPRS